MSLVANIDETIVAIASAHDVGGQRGIVRMSGDATIAATQLLFEPTSPLDWGAVQGAQRIAGTILLESLGQVPCDLYLWPHNRSYTQQPTAELHTYGSLPILEAIVARACQLGARLAQPGEFTLRSFLSGRIDLAQAEAVLGVIDAASDREIQVALSQLAGGLTQPLTELRDTLLNLVADLEAGLDFVDEDIEFITVENARRELNTAQITIDRTLQQIGARDSGGPLPRVVLRGEPNVGKSSLWNALVSDGRAIVDATAGTTRDYLVGTVQGNHRTFLLVDTAGVESASSPMQASMGRLGESQADAASLVLLCIDSGRPLTQWERDELSSLDERTIVVLTKSDLAGEHAVTEFERVDARINQDDLQSIQNLACICSNRLSTLAPESSVVANTATRCRESLRLAGESVAHARQLIETSAGDELVVSELRTALDQLGLIVGAIYNDDILDRVFSRFCIGK